MLLDTIHGTIARRVLLNYRADPEVIRRVLPAPFRPKLYKHHAIGGVCMIRFRALRPRWAPAFVGIDSENAAHRIAVEWERNGEHKEGVFIPQRNTASLFNKALGGKVFPGLFVLSRFDVRESADSISIRILDANGNEEVHFEGESAESHSAQSVFPSLEDAANFFSLGATGYSATADPNRFEGMELRSLSWKIAPLRVNKAYSRWFSRADLFPANSIELDSALIMRDIPHEWHSRPELVARS
jgi:hypothetical protein